MGTDELKYSKEHEWVDKNGIVGITDYAQKELGDVVFVELPKIGAEYAQGKEMAVLESVKAVSNVYTPVSGRIKKINDKLASEPELINKDPYKSGWIAEIEVKDLQELENLMNEEAYKKYLDELHSSH